MGSPERLETAGQAERIEMREKEMTDLKPLPCKTCGEAKYLVRGLTHYVVCSECGGEVCSLNKEEAISLWNDLQRVLRCRNCDLPPSMSTEPWVRDSGWEVSCWKCGAKTSAKARKDAVDLWNKEQSCKN